MVALALTLTLGGAGCAQNGEAYVLLSWQLADGRSCLDAGIADVYIDEGDGQKALDWGYFRCEHGRAPASIALAGIHEHGQHLRITAESWYGAPLYRGELSGVTLPASATVTLFALEAP